MYIVSQKYWSQMHGKLGVIVTKWAYPYGGGEQFMRQSTFLARDFCWVWLAFCNAKNEPFELTEVDTFYDNSRDTKPQTNARPSFAHMIKVSGGFTERKLYVWLRMLRPVIVHHQGALRTEVERAAHTLKIPVIAGFHFWHGMMLMSEQYGNIRMLEHAEHHKMDPNYEFTKARSDVVYVPSVYFRDVIEQVGGKANSKLLDVIPPISDESEVLFKKTKKPKCLFKGDDLSRFKNGFVTMINIHECKGGKLFLYMLQHLDPSIPLLGVRTDVFQTKTDVAIDKCIRERKTKNAFLIGRQNDVSKIYRRTGLLLQASECDETFCRVALEAHANSIPTLVSDYGNVPYLLATDEAKSRTLVKSAGLHEDGTKNYYQKWCNAIEREWKLIKQASQKSKKPLSEICRQNYEEICRQNDLNNLFNTALNRAVNCGKERRWRNVGLFAPWCDQGLGIQTRNYARLLMKYNFCVFIFAFMPYTGKREQANEREWALPGVAVYYSPNHRESVTSAEIAAFVAKTQIGLGIIAETCWNRVFSMMKELRSMDVRTFAVPNVEIVRKDEIEKHRVFDSILINNNACRRLFVEHGFPSDRLQEIGYAAEVREDVLEEINARNRTQKPLFNKKGQRVLRFLIVGGRNAIFRKHVDIVLDAFLSVFKPGDPVHLTGTSQLDCKEFTPLQPLLAQKDAPATLIIGNLSSEKISDLYSNTDIVFQVSKHEGLGIGFFEALQFEKPICTLDMEPHNECAPTSVAWQLKPDALEENTENNSCGVLSARVSKQTFVPFFEKIRAALCVGDDAKSEKWWQEQYLAKQKHIYDHNRDILKSFEERFISALSQFS